MFYELKRNLRKLKHLSDVLFAFSRDPAPYYIKHLLLKDFFPTNSIAVETGTYLGETTEMLSKHCSSVVSLEPFVPLYEYNARRFGSFDNVSIVNKSSEEGFAEILEVIEGPTSFWLDGHYSGDGTHGKLANASPIVRELESIAMWVHKTNSPVYVAIDDARLFTGEDGYPDEVFIREFAVDHRMIFFRFRDIFFIKKA